jgi:hypothetical protein
MESLIRSRKAPVGSIAPLKIEMAGLFALDVNDDIWQDTGLDDEDPTSEPPLWLSNMDVRDGIRRLLELDRCREEESRIKKERRTMQEWFSEEWNVVNEAIKKPGIKFSVTNITDQHGVSPTSQIIGSEALHYMLGLRRITLLVFVNNGSREYHLFPWTTGTLWTGDLQWTRFRRLELTVLWHS